MARMDIPLRIRWLRFKTDWRIERVLPSRTRAARTFAFPTLRDGAAFVGTKIEAGDPWSCREAFLALPKGDENQLLRFLSKTGLFSIADGEVFSHWSKEVMDHCNTGNPPPLDVQALWECQSSLRGALLQPETFLAGYAKRRVVPKNEFEFVRDRLSGFPLHFEMAKLIEGGVAPVGVIETQSTHEALLASVFFDVSRGLEFGACQRRGCDRLFSRDGDGRKARKVFCSQNCAHVETERRGRPRRAAARG